MRENQQTVIMPKFNMLEDSIEANIQKEKIFVCVTTVVMGCFGIWCSHALVATEDFFANQNPQPQFRYTSKASTVNQGDRRPMPSIAPERKSALKAQCRAMGIPECQ